MSQDIAFAFFIKVSKP